MSYQCPTCGGWRSCWSADIYKPIELPEGWKELHARAERAEQERDLYRAEMSEAKAAGFESAQDLWTSYRGAEQEREQLRADAERYRWIKENLWAFCDGVVHGAAAWREDTDAAIDAARQAAGKP